MDYHGALKLNAGEDRLYPLICYHCQQTAEKAVKALIVRMGEPGGLPKKHDVTFLLNQVKNLVAALEVTIPESLWDAADRLNRYAIAPRYPGEIEAGHEDAETALKDAGEILNWVERVSGQN